MKLEDIREAYEDLSGKASDIVRQLGFAGIALIWVFKSASNTAPILDRGLINAASFIFLALMLDLCLYLLGATIWFVYFRHKERQRTSASADFKANSRLNWPSWTLFYLKILSMLIAYGGYIIPFLFHRFAV